MKDILSLLVFQVLLIFVVKDIKICQADVYELGDRAAYNWETSNYNRAGFDDQAPVGRANPLYEQDFGARDRYQNKYSARKGRSRAAKAARLRSLQRQYPEEVYQLRNAYLPLGNTDSKDSTSLEGDDSVAASVSAEGGLSNGTIVSDGNANTTSRFQSKSISLSAKKTFSSKRGDNNKEATAHFSIDNGIQSNQGSGSVQSSESCMCDNTMNAGSSFLCFYSENGSNEFSIKSKGLTTFNLEDIIRAYTFYFNSIGDHKFNFDLNGKIDMNTFKGDKVITSDMQLIDLNDIKNGKHTFDIDAMSKLDIKHHTKKNKNKVDINAFIDSIKKLNINGKLDGQTKYNSEIDWNTDVNTNFDFNSNFNIDGEADFDAVKNMEYIMQVDEMAKAIAQAKAQAKIKAKADAKTKAIMHNQIIAQAEAQAIAEAQAKAKAQAIVNAQVDAHLQAQAQAQAQAEAQGYLNAQGNAQANAQAQAQVKGGGGGGIKGSGGGGIKGGGGGGIKGFIGGKKGFNLGGILGGEIEGGISKSIGAGISKGIGAGFGTGFGAGFGGGGGIGTSAGAGGSLSANIGGGGSGATFLSLVNDDDSEDLENMGGYTTNFKNPDALGSHPFSFTGFSGGTKFYGDDNVWRQYKTW